MEAYLKIISNFEHLRQMNLRIPLKRCEDAFMRVADQLSRPSALRAVEAFLFSSGEAAEGFGLYVAFANDVAVLTPGMTAGIKTWRTFDLLTPDFDSVGDAPTNCFSPVSGMCCVNYA